MIVFILTDYCTDSQTSARVSYAICILQERSSKDKVFVLEGITRREPKYGERLSH